MTTLYHSYSYTPYENAPIEPYSYPRGQLQGWQAIVRPSTSAGLSLPNQRQTS